jgi:hypothetical protein
VISLPDGMAHAMAKGLADAGGANRCGRDAHLKSADRTQVFNKEEPIDALLDRHAYHAHII